MGALEQVLQLKKQGVSDKEIIKVLKQQGIPPKDIDMALQQASIKGAVSQTVDANTQAVNTSYQEQNPSINFNEMQPSLLDSLQNTQQEGFVQGQDAGIQQLQPQQEYYPEQTAQTSTQGYYQPQTQEYYPPQEQYNQGEYPTQVYTPETGLDSETITEIAEQVLQDRTNEIKAQISGLNEFKTIINAQVENVESRLQRMEQVIDKLQMAILEKIGSYVSTTENIKKEMSMMQDSFSKVISNKENLYKLKEMTKENNKAKETNSKKKKR